MSLACLLMRKESSSASKSTRSNSCRRRAERQRRESARRARYLHVLLLKGLVALPTKALGQLHGVGHGLLAQLQMGKQALELVGDAAILSGIAPLVVMPFVESKSEFRRLADVSEDE